jgi:GDPmannose 4,6-dehydratase
LYEDVHDGAPRFILHYGDMLDESSLRRIISKVQPDEIYNLAAQSHVSVSYDQPEYTTDVIATGTLRLLEAVRDYARDHNVRIYQAGSSEMYGSSAPPQHEDTPFHPRSPYAVAKAAAHWQCVNYREAYGMFITNGILFNHESPRRGENFVTRKITRALTRIQLGLQSHLYLGNLNARRDWGFAGDYVNAMWLMLQQEKPDDFVVATGEAYSVRDFLDASAKRLNMDWQKYVRIDPAYIRPTEVDFLQGDATKARQILGWRPRFSFQELVEMMVDEDYELARQESMHVGTGDPCQTERVAHA